MVYCNIAQNGVLSRLLNAVSNRRLRCTDRNHTDALEGVLSELGTVSGGGEG